MQFYPADTQVGIIVSLGIDRRSKFNIAIANLRIEHLACLYTDWNVKPAVDRVQVNEVPESMPLDRLQERRPTAFKAFEEICAAEAHKALAGARKSFEDRILFESRGLQRRCADIVTESVAG